MAHDDDKPETGDDPWAGLEAEGLPELGADFAFSFEEEAVAGDQADARGGDLDDAAAAIDAVLDGGLEAEAEAAAAGLLSGLSDSAADSLPVSEPDDVPEPPRADDSGFPRMFDTTTDASTSAEADPGVDAEIDDWLGGSSDGDAAASSVLAAGVFGEVDEDSGELPDFTAGESGVSIGTGTSGILSPSGIDALGEGEPAPSAVEGDPFAGLAAEPMDWAATETPAGDADPSDGESADDFAGAFDITAATAVAAGAGAAAAAGGGDEPKRATGKSKRPAPARKRKPSVVGQLVGVVLGGAMAIPVTLGILIWGFGKDPFNLTPMLPDSVAFLLPAKFRPAGAVVGLPQAPSLDDIVGTPPASGNDAADDGEAALPSGDDLAGSLPEPAPTDLAVVDPTPSAGDGEPADDPLMDLLDESVPSVTPPAAAETAPPPAPEPLDLEKLGVTIAEAKAALEAVAAVDDPSDPVRRRLLAKWYRALAGYAEELAAVERLAMETGRPFEAAVEQGEAVRAGLADHPQLLAELARLTSDWIAYAKRPSDGVVAPARFVLARRVGPYWRSQVTLAATDVLPERELVVLTRAEPAVAPGDEVLVVGLAVDDNVVWASDLRPAAAAAGFPGL